MPDDFLDALELLARNHGFPKLLEVNGRTVFRGDGANLVPCDDVPQQVLCFKPFDKLREMLVPHRGSRLRSEAGVEQPACVYRFVQVVAHLGAVVLREKIDLLFGRVNPRADFLELKLLVLEAQLKIGQSCFEVARIARSKKFREKAISALELPARGFSLLLEVGDFRANGFRLPENRIVSGASFAEGGILADGQTSLAHEILEECVHHLEAVGVPDVVAEQDVVLEKVDVVLAAIEKNEAILQQVVERREVIAEERAARLGDDGLLDVNEDLRNLLANCADDRLASRLQLGEPRLNHVRGLASLEVLSALPNPFLAFQDEIGELISGLLGEELDERKPEEQIDFDIFLILGLGERTLQEVAEAFAEGAAVRPFGFAKLDSRKVRGAGVLPDQLEKIFPRPLDEFGAEEHIMVNIVNADGQ